jgi:ATP synthase F1 delta subunit
MADKTLVASYSDALFNAALKANVLKEVAEDAEKLTAIVAREKKLRAFSETPSISLEEKERVFRKVFGSRYHEMLINFVCMLIRRGRLELFFPALERLRVLYQRHLGYLDATVVSAVPLHPEDRNLLVNELSTFTGKKLNITWKIDPTIIGGLRFLCGDTLIDTTLSRSLAQIGRRLGQVRVY